MVQSECSCCSNTGKVIFEWCKQVADDRHAPGPAEEPLPCQSAHVGHVRIVDWEAKDPLHLSAPEYVFLLVHEDREVLVLALLDGIRPGGDGPHLVKLSSPAVF